MAFIAGRNFVIFVVNIIGLQNSSGSAALAPLVAIL
jgi:hypothetical protein